MAHLKRFEQEPDPAKANTCGLNLVYGLLVGNLSLLWTLLFGIIPDIVVLHKLGSKLN